MRSALCLTLAWVLLAFDGVEAQDQGDDGGVEPPCFAEQEAGKCLVCAGDRRGPSGPDAVRASAEADVPFCHDQNVGDLNGGYVCGEFGCMKTGASEGACLQDNNGRAQAACQPDDDCTADPMQSMDAGPNGYPAQPNDFRGSYPTCNNVRCYVPNMSDGATADNLRSVKCEHVDVEDEGDGSPVGAIFSVLVAIFVVYGCSQSVYQVSQREVIIIERFGKYNKTLNAGLNFVVPYIDRPKTYSYKYILTDGDGAIQVKQKIDECKISTQEEVLDFPKQRAISRDNAIIELDAVLNFKILHPKVFIYSCVNLPLILSKLLQAQLRNVAGSLELDQMIQDAAQLNVLTGLLDMEAQRWGVQIQFVKVQQVKYSHNPQILSLVKDTENKNKEIIIDAKSKKQKAIIESEGQRDKMIKEAEGAANEHMANARGLSQALRNKAAGESRTIREVAKALKNAGESNPTKYLLSLKYLEAVKNIAGMPNTNIKYVPKNVSDGASNGNAAQSVAMGVGLMLGQSFGKMGGV